MRGFQTSGIQAAAEDLKTDTKTKEQSKSDTKKKDGQYIAGIKISLEYTNTEYTVPTDFLIRTAIVGFLSLVLLSGISGSINNCAKELRAFRKEVGEELRKWKAEREEKSRGR